MISIRRQKKQKKGHLASQTGKFTGALHCSFPELGTY